MTDSFKHYKFETNNCNVFIKKYDLKFWLFAFAIFVTTVSLTITETRVEVPIKTHRNEPKQHKLWDVDIAQVDDYYY